MCHLLFSGGRPEKRRCIVLPLVGIRNTGVRETDMEVFEEFPAELKIESQLRQCQGQVFDYGFDTLSFPVLQKSSPVCHRNRQGVQAFFSTWMRGGGT